MRAVIIICTLALVACCLAAPASEDEKEKAAKLFVIKLNGKNKGEWKAKYHKGFAHMTEEQRKQMAGGNGGDKKDHMAPAPESDEDEAVLAKSAEINEQRRRKRQATCTDNTAFDVRNQWPGCAALVNQIQNQATCGSCWAVSTASAFTDRYCIALSKQGISTDANDPHNRASAADIMSCAPGGGCNGGSTYNAWMWTNYTGVVSGTDYPAQSGCKPYPFDPNNWQMYTAPACAQQCSNSAWTTPYSVKRFVKSVGILGGPGHITDYENEIRANGPVVASMDIYEGFYYYSSGVYKHVETTIQGSHAVKMIGWGTRSCTDGTSQDYWLVANSWGDGWGENGFFQIAKGSNECGIEQKQITWGIPNV